MCKYLHTFLSESIGSADVESGELLGSGENSAPLPNSLRGKLQKACLCACTRGGNDDVDRVRVEVRVRARLR